MQAFFQTLVSGLSFGAVYALVALGFSLVYRTMGLVNFAHGAVLMIGAYVASTFYLSARLPFAVAVPAAIAVNAVLGLLIERVLRPLENKDFDLMLIGTIGAGTALEAAAVLIWSSSGRGVPTPVRTAPLDVGGVRIPTYNVVVIGVAAIVMVALTLFLQRTKRGAAMQAVAMDHEAATAVGIHVGRSNAISFAIGAGLAALAGCWSARFCSSARRWVTRSESRGSPRPSSAVSAASPAPSSAGWVSASSARSPRSRSRGTPTWSHSWYSRCLS